MHRENIARIVDETLQASNTSIEDVDAIAVTNRPGNKHPDNVIYWALYNNR